MPVVRREGDLLDELAGPGRRPALWRPLLAVRRAALDAYCRRWGIEPLADPTNADPALRRNAIRHEILPAIERHFPDAVATLARSAGVLAEEDRFLDEETGRRWNAVGRIDAPLVILHRAALRAEPTALQRRLVRHAWRLAGGPAAVPSAALTDLVREAIAGGRTGARLSLPEGLALIVERDRAVLGPASGLEAELRRRAGVPLIEPGRREPVDAPRTVPLEGGWAIRVERAAARGAPPLHIPLDDRGCAGGTRAERSSGWVLRSWQAGDRLPARGGGRGRKLQDWFVDHRVPRYLRRHLVVLARGGVVTWIAGLACFPLGSSARDGGGEGWRLQVLQRGEPAGGRDARMSVEGLGAGDGEQGLGGGW